VIFLRVRKVFSENLLKYIVAIPLLVQLWFISEDTWDGLILRYGLATGDISGWLAGVDESGWEIIRPVTDIQLLMALVTGTDYFFGYKVVVSIGILFLAREAYILLSSLFRLTPFWANAGVALTLSNPVWTATSGSVMIIHVLAIPAALAGVRLLMGSKWTVIFSVPFLLFAFELDSMLMFVPVLAGAYSLIRNPLGENWTSAFWSRQGIKSLITFLFAVGYFFLSQALNPKFGRYETYNSLDRLTSVENLASIFKASIWFGLLTLPALVLIATLLWVSVSNLKVHKNAGLFLESKRVFLCISLLLLASSLPYILVSKAPVFFEIYDWNGRHGFAFSLVLAIATAYSLSVIQETTVLTLKKLPITVASILIFVQLGATSLGFAYKYESIEYDNRLTVELKKALPSIPEGFLVMDFSGEALPRHSRDGSIRIQYLIYEAMGNPAWRSTSDLSAHQEKLDPNLLTETSRLRDIYSGSFRSCTSHTLIAGDGWGNPFGYYLHGIFSDQPKKLQIHLLSTVCNPD
jgi:hypothetical protein